MFQPFEVASSRPSPCTDLPQPEPRFRVQGFLLPEYELQSVRKNGLQPATKNARFIYFSLDSNSLLTLSLSVGMKQDFLTTQTGNEELGLCPGALHTFPSHWRFLLTSPGLHPSKNGFK